MSSWDIISQDTYHCFTGLVCDFLSSEEQSVVVLPWMRLTARSSAGCLLDLYSHSTAAAPPRLHQSKTMKQQPVAFWSFYKAQPNLSLRAIITRI